MKRILALVMGLLFFSATGLAMADQGNFNGMTQGWKDKDHQQGGHDRKECKKTTTPTPLPSATATLVMTPTPKATDTPRATGTPTATAIATATRIATGTPTVTGTSTAMVLATGTASSTPSASPTATLFAALTATPTPQSVQGPVNLGSAASFVVLAATTITNSGATTLCGDLGLSPGSSVTGAPVMSCGGVMHITDSSAAQAELDATTAFNTMAGLPGGTLIAGNLGGLTLSPGLYKSTSTLAISSGNLTLDARGNPNAVFIFQIATSLTTSPGVQVILAGGAQASNVYWQVGSLCSLNTGTAFKGTIIAGTQITMNTGAVLIGRAFALTAQVTMLSNTVTMP